MNIKYQISNIKFSIRHWKLEIGSIGYFWQSQSGFTFIEAILYVAILIIMLSAIIPFAWNVIESGSKSATQEEVSSNARYISERIKYEIRNASGINSVSSTSISLSETISANNPTVITFTSPNITIKQGTGTTTNLNSNDVTISAVTFTNNTSGDTKTKNISFVFTTAYNTSSRTEFQNSMTVQNSAELRSN